MSSKTYLTLSLMTVVIVVMAIGVMTSGNTIDAAGSPPPAPQTDGSVKFFVDASTSFDDWTRSPTPEQRAWMREHYFRMQTYSSYFGPRVEWYPNAWVYKDSYAIYPDSEVRRTRPEWILRDADGNELYIPFGCSGGTCPQFAADIGNPEFRGWWIDALRETLADGYLGVWVDDVNMAWRVSDGDGERATPVDPRTGAGMTLSDWRRYFAEFMEEIRAEFPDIEIAHNVIWYAQPADDPFIQRQLRAADFINLERGATDSGIRGGGGTYGYETLLGFIDRAHEMGNHVILDDDDSTTDTEWMYELATYFLVKAGDDMIGADADRSRMNPNSFWEGYEIDLGDALGGRYEIGGLLRRDYRCGVVLLNQPDRRTRTVDL
ncbi:MAG: putative glycoside hydrolase, partial [Gemmatimonadota bacterium]|nr:putative glycoside hydrolase [Gemmatimonadota bacterium]